jgi:hypothetical protein
MSTMKTATVEPDRGARTLPGVLGARNDLTLKAMFGSSPMYTGQYGVSTVEDAGRIALQGGGSRIGYQTAPSSGILSTLGVADGAVTDSSTYYGFRDSVNLNYVGAPNIDTEVAYGGGAGQPTSPYVPSLVSPGEGNGIDPLLIPAYTGPMPTRNTQYGSGRGSELQPSEAAEEISNQEIPIRAGTSLNSYISGKSYATSIGAYSGP